MFGLLLAMSALTGWYTGEGNGATVSVIGWHGTIGKVVLFLGLQRPCWSSCEKWA